MMAGLTDALTTRLAKHEKRIDEIEGNCVRNLVQANARRKMTGENIVALKQPSKGPPGLTSIVFRLDAETYALEATVTDADGAVFICVLAWKASRRILI